MFIHEGMLSQRCHTERSEPPARICYQLRPAVPSFVGMTAPINKCSIMNFFSSFASRQKNIKRKTKKLTKLQA
jgi:hypothetical protein